MKTLFGYNDCIGCNPLDNTDDHGDKSHEHSKFLQFTLVREPLYELVGQLQRIEFSSAAHVNEAGDDAENTQDGIEDAAKKEWDA